MREWISLLFSGNKATIAPFGQVDTTRRPVLLIHGVGTPAILADVAVRLDAAGLQVWFVFYDDLGVDPHINGREIAKALIEVFDTHYKVPGDPNPSDRELDIVAHSLGGIVARCAVNELQEPGWRGDPPSFTPNARAGFKSIRLRTIDTPWSGFGPDDIDDYSDTSDEAWIVKTIMDLLDVEGGYELGAGTQTMQKLFDVELQDVDLRNLLAYRPGKKDWVPSLPELEPERAKLVGRYIVNDEIPDPLTILNLCKGLEQDANFPTLKLFMELAVLYGALDLDVDPATQEMQQDLANIHNLIMPRFEGGHIGVALDRASDAEDLVDYLVDTLAP